MRTPLPSIHGGDTPSPPRDYEPEQRRTRAPSPPRHHGAAARSPSSSRPPQVASGYDSRGAEIRRQQYDRDAEAWRLQRAKETRDQDLRDYRHRMEKQRDEERQHRGRDPRDYDRKHKS